MMHALVLLSVTGTTPRSDELQHDHERFIDRLDADNKVVLGGHWQPPTAGIDSAYLLNCQSLQEAHQLAAADPLVRGDAVRCHVIEWELVGVNPDAVDRSSLRFP
jgi:uncharacterized protein YciI